MEEKVWIDSGNLRLEGLFDPVAKNRAVAVTHPHPLYGGDMANPVVEAVARAYARAGWATLRFNFRGTGGSQGTFDNGLGEQADVRAALDFLRYRGFSEIDLAGYSFGAWVNALACTREPPPGRMVMVAPPVNLLDFRPVTSLPALGLVITGERDDFGDAQRARSLATGWNPSARVERIDGADHFFGPDLDRIGNLVFDFLRQPKAPVS